MLTMGPYHYLSIKKAATADAWLALRESTTDAPNYFFTDDFKSFKQISALEPQKQFNWFTAELINWSLPDGQRCQGVLYKPENFDTQKKYPLLVYIYEELSDELFHYLAPQATSDKINIPYFVSRGYLVFVPDIHYETGHIGESALASVESGVKYLSKASWIDFTKLGLQGHSFGACEANYIITHSNLFAAAEEGAGCSDLISASYSLVHDGISNQWIFEKTQYRMGGSLWEHPERYIEGSAILNSDKVTAPLLMMHNKQDAFVPWTQGVEFFSALRRCGKKAWMLQYDNGEHFVQPGQDALDFTIRIEQFFNHYLKGTPPPKWMTVGVPPNKKGIENGYELDLTNKCGDDCPVCNKRQY